MRYCAKLIDIMRDHVMLCKSHNLPPPLLIFALLGSYPLHWGVKQKIYDGFLEI